MRCAQRPVGRAALSPYRAQNSLAPLCRTCTANTKLPIKTHTSLHSNQGNNKYIIIIIIHFSSMCIYYSLCSIHDSVSVGRIISDEYRSVYIYVYTYICIVNIAVTLCRCRLCNFIMMFYAVLLYYILINQIEACKRKTCHSYMVLNIIFVSIIVGRSISKYLLLSIL